MARAGLLLALIAVLVSSIYAERPLQRISLGRTQPTSLLHGWRDGGHNIPLLNYMDAQV
jgi:hypothetical protein